MISQGTAASGDLARRRDARRGRGRERERAPPRHGGADGGRGSPRLGRRAALRRSLQMLAHVLEGEALS